MPMICVVHGCANRSNREKEKRFFRVPKVIVHKGDKWKTLTEQRRKKWILNLRLQSGGAESANARVCSDHFVKGCPSALDDTESVDWAPTISLGYQNTKTKSEASLQREQRMKRKEDHRRRLEFAKAIVVLQQIPWSAGMSSGPPRVMDASAELKEEPSDQQDLCTSGQNCVLKIKQEENVDFPDPPMDITTRLKEEPSDDQDINPPMDVSRKLKEEPNDQEDLYPPEDISTRLKEPTDHQDIKVFSGWPSSTRQDQTNNYQTQVLAEQLKMMQDIREDESGGEEYVESNENDEVRIIEEVSLSSDSDMSEVEPECETEDPQTNSEQAKDGTVWSKIAANANRERGHVDNVKRETSGPTHHAKEKISSVLTSFLCLLDTEMLASIMRYTEAEAGGNRASPFNLTMEELKAFIGLLFLRGITGGKRMSLEDYWSADFGFPIFKETMSRQRFRDIMKYLRFDAKTTRAARLEEDKFAMISEIFGQFVKNCISCYTPGPDITVDEHLFPTKARCRFTQYMAKKPDKFGIKFWVAADANSNYMLNMFPDLGKDENRSASQRLPDSVVLRLMEPFLDKGRNVATDEFFTSLQLAKSLLARKTTIVGAIKKTKREIPPCAQAQSAERFSTKVMRAGKATLTIYQTKPKKNVCILSTMHQTVSVDEGTKKLPNTVSHYNSTKYGVDMMDQIARLYSVKGGSRRWSVAVFYNMLDLAGVNAHILYQQCTGRDFSRRQFLLELAKELCTPRRAARATAVRLFTPATPFATKLMFAHKIRAARATTAASQLFRATPSPPTKRKKCQVRRCLGNKTSEVCSSCGRLACGKCCILSPVMCKDCSEVVSEDCGEVEVEMH